MKKIFSFFAFIIILFGINAFAANGDIIGNIYSTDILAFVDGVPIESYNIGGKTVIIIEDLMGSQYTGYGFDVTYNEEERTLYVYSQGHSGYNATEIIRGKVGDITGFVYESDINVIFNSHIVPGYNIGGRTAVCIEDLGMTENGMEYSEYLCNAKWDETERTIHLNTYQNIDLIQKYPVKKLIFRQKNDLLSVSFNQENSISPPLEVDFDEEFLNEKFIIKNLYGIMPDGSKEVIGSFYIGSGNKLYVQYDEYKMAEMTKDIAIVFSYDEAVDYILKNYEVIDSREDNNAKVYLGKKDGITYLLLALKKGGYVNANSFSTDRTIIEFRDIADGTFEVYEYPFAGPPTSGITGMTSVIDTSLYDLCGTYNNYRLNTLSHYSQGVARTGKIKIYVDKQEFFVDALVTDLNNYSYCVDVDKMCDILNIDYKFVNGVFDFRLDGGKKDFSYEETPLDEKPVSDIYTMYSLKVSVNGEAVDFVWRAGGTTLTGGSGYDKVCEPYLYNNQAYVPLYFFEKNFKIG